ncbi:M56 family metallopeptidase [uncultured Mucilaginibacter sp.]|uniref:M56 family metallopeptidase n=1 Tax=uncultured Mucilaginibacter sp. TaxID=797541 RepID=UPI0026281D98|nr:M56 family metallopeptidase [uncultured Mucilaginibacter sp.]
MLYYTFFRKEKFLVINRFVLIGIIAIAFALPVLPTFHLNGFGISPLHPPVETGNVFPKFTVDKEGQRILIDAYKPVKGNNYPKLLIMVYAITSAILLIIFFANLYKVWTIIRTSHRHKVNGIIYCEPVNKTAPFSFFNFIVVSKITFNTEEYQQIITHEKAHSRQLHSIDVLIADLACILLWINPLIYLHRRQLKLNLEFLADEATLKSGINALYYQYNLLHYSGMLTDYPSMNTFLTSKMKERIIMINTERPQMSKSYKYIMLMPMILLLSVLTGFREEALAFTEKTIFAQKLSTLSSNPQETTQPQSAKSPNKVKREIHSQVLPSDKQPIQKYFSVSIDARTDTVKFSLVPDTLNRKFKGIYVIGDKVFSDDEIRAALAPSGKLQMVLANQPIIGMYTANDSSAVRRWGEQARPGVVFVTARLEIPSQ